MADRRFDEALATFKRAEAELVRLQARHTDTNAKLLQATMAATAVDQQIEAFAKSTEADPNSAAHLIGEQDRARSVALLLEQAEAFLEGEVEKAKRNVAAAEKACASAQAAHFAKSLDDDTDAFVRDNTARIQRLVQTMYLAGKFEALSRGDPTLMGVNAWVETWTTNVLPSAVKRVLGSDERWRSECVPSKVQPIGSVVTSNRISDAERGRIHRNEPAPSRGPVDADDDFDMSLAVAMRNRAASDAESNRSYAQDYRRRLELHPGDPNLQSGAEEYERAAKHHEDIVRNWDEKIAARRETV